MYTTEGNKSGLFFAPVTAEGGSSKKSDWVVPSGVNSAGMLTGVSVWEELADSYVKDLQRGWRGGGLEIASKPKINDSKRRKQ